MKILIAGDFVPTRRVAKLVESEQYSEVFAGVREFTDKADYSILNFESPVVINEATPIKKTGPNLKCSEKALYAVKYAGFDCVTLANNHFYDFGEIGVKNTLESCKKLNVNYVGGGKNLTEASAILYRTIKGKKLAIINVCEHEWSIATLTTGGSAPLNPIHNFYTIVEAKQNADYVLVITHGGTEHYNLPTPRQQQVYRFFIDAGADAVVNHHQHCYSGYEEHNGKPIFYGLGNFCFDGGSNAPNFWQEGFILELYFAKKISYKLIPYKQCAENPKIDFNVNLCIFNKKIQKLNRIIENSSLLYSAFRQMAQYHNKLQFLEPFQSRIARALRKRNLLPLLIGKQKLRILYAIFKCEAHRDIIFENFRQRLK